MDLERQALESVQAWLSGDARWFALANDEGFAVIACSKEKLQLFTSWPMPAPVTAAEVTAITNCRAFLNASGRPHGRLELSKGMYAHFGMKSALAEAVVSTVPRE